MLLWLLLLHLGIHLLTATRHAPAIKNSSVRPIDNKYVIQRIDSCPDVGYFFKRDRNPNRLNPGPCYLCFCQGQDTAVCWKRENKRCDVESFHYHGLGKRDTRIRRSPAGFGDIFFRDATRDIFNRQAPEQCKPFESSFSDGCPPADWCIGCTVCDCDANGRWDCHILSFCPDKKGGKKLKKRKHRIQPPNMDMDMEAAIQRAMATTVATPKRSPAKKPQIPKQKSVARVNNKATLKSRIVKKSVPKVTTKRPPKKKMPRRYKKVVSKNTTTRPTIINKNVATHNPVDMEKRTKMLKLINSNNETVKIAQQVVKRVMAAVQKMVRSEMKNMTKFINPIPNPKSSYKKVKKRHVEKKNGKNKPMRKYIKRNKRSAMAIDSAELNMTTVGVTGKITLALTETTRTANNSLNTDNVTIMPSNFHNQSEYYKYSEGVDQLTTYKPVSTNNVSHSETVPNLMSTERMTPISFDKVSNKENEITSILDDANDLKFKKWAFVKVFKEKHLKNNSNTYARNIEKIIKDRNVDLLHPNNKVHSKNIERKLVTKKYNVVKIVNSHKMIRDETNQNQSTVRAISSTLTDLQHSILKLFSKFHRNNTVINKRKPKKPSILKYLKKLFNRFFKHKKPKMGCINEFKVIETLCDTFGPCKINNQNKMLLKSKLKHLNDETIRILKSIKIIKGLLQLVDIPDSNNKYNTNHMNQSTFGNDIRKLNSILRGTYVKYDNLSLTATQMIQIDYIKKNTQNFIQSVSNFATLLKEIVAIIVPQNNTDTDKIHRILRDTHHDNNVEDDPFRGFKNLLAGYNLVQNDFIRKMYSQLSDFESKIKQKKVSENEHKDLNNSVAIEMFSRNIITNLRKLKQVAKSPNSSGRIKRDAVTKENTIEYMLMVMEYLMKQNHHLDAAPVNDGIDLLIDAIRNAPDIKTVQKKVLTHVHTVASNQSELLEKSDSEDNNTNIKDDSKSIDDSKDFAEQMLYEKDNEEKAQINRNTDDATEKLYYSKLKDTISTEAIITESTSQEPPTGFHTIKSAIADDSNKVEIDMMYIDKKEPEIGDNDDKKLDGMDEIGSENHNGIALRRTYPNKVKTAFPYVTVTTTTEEMETWGPVTQTKVTTDKPTNYNNISKSIDSKDTKYKFNIKSQLDWIEENFGINPRRYNITDTTVTPLHNNYNTTTIMEVKKDIPINQDTSGMTNEIVDDDKKKKSINAEEVMLKKQMDFLNSLDYGTERIEFEESESKDSNDERYSGGSFPSYFV